MIDRETFSIEWVNKINEELHWKRPGNQLKNIEKAITALYLLECLTESDLKFIFKGGTSLLLLLQKVQRFSVDIDVLVDDIDDFNKISLQFFKELIAKNDFFTEVTADEREGDALTNTYHYRFYYEPFVNQGEKSYILLDVYHSHNYYDEVVEAEICSDILNTTGKNATALIPSINCLLADKLTAFAPETIGISLAAEPGKRPKRVEVMKQLYDIGNLFEHCDKLQAIINTYKKVATYEIERRDLSITYSETLQDTLRHAYILGFAGLEEIEKHKQFMDGLKDFRRFVADLSFDETNAILMAARVAYITTLIIVEGTVVEFYSADIGMESWGINKKGYESFNSYKQSNPEAFYYWFRAIEINA